MALLSHREEALVELVDCLIVWEDGEQFILVGHNWGVDQARKSIDQRMLARTSTKKLKVQSIVVLPKTFSGLKLSLKRAVCECLPGRIGVWKGWRQTSEISS